MPMHCSVTRWNIVIFMIKNCWGPHRHKQFKLFFKVIQSCPRQQQRYQLFLKRKHFGIIESHMLIPFGWIKKIIGRIPRLFLEERKSWTDNRSILKVFPGMTFRLTRNHIMAMDHLHQEHIDYFAFWNYILIFQCKVMNQIA